MPSGKRDKSYLIVTKVIMKVTIKATTAPIMLINKQLTLKMITDVKSNVLWVSDETRFTPKIRRISAYNGSNGFLIMTNTSISDGSVF